MPNNFGLGIEDVTRKVSSSESFDEENIPSSPSSEVEDLLTPSKDQAIISSGSSSCDASMYS